MPQSGPAADDTAPQGGPARILISLSHALPLSTAPLHHRRACFSLTVAYSPPPLPAGGRDAGRADIERRGKGGRGRREISSPLPASGPRRTGPPAAVFAASESRACWSGPRGLMPAGRAPSSRPRREPAWRRSRRPASRHPPASAGPPQRLSGPRLSRGPRLGPPRTAGLDPSVTARGRGRWCPPWRPPGPRPWVATGPMPAPDQVRTEHDRLRTAGRRLSVRRRRRRRRRGGCGGKKGRKTGAGRPAAKCRGSHCCAPAVRAALYYCACTWRANIRPARRAARPGHAREARAPVPPRRDARAGRLPAVGGSRRRRKGACRR